METKTTESSTQRVVRGSRGARVSASRGNQSQRPSSPRNKSPASKSSKEENSRPIRGSQNAFRGPRIARPRGRGRTFRRDNRPRQQNFRRRLERAQFAFRNQRRMRGRFRGRRGFFGMRRRLFRRRSIFIKGFPKRMSENTITDMLRKEGRVLRVTLLRDRQGESRGMAFAEFQSPRDAFKVVQNYRGKLFEGNEIFVAFKRENRFRNYNYPRYYNRNRNIGKFNNYRPGFNSNRFPRQTRPLRAVNRGRGRGRGRIRGF